MCTDKIKSHAPVCMHVYAWTCASDLSAARSSTRLYYIDSLLFLFYVDDV